MKTFLFTMNPKKWYWENIDQTIALIKQTGHESMSWSVASHKKVQPRDRAFLMRLGVEPKGIMGAGFVSSMPFLAPHWSGENKLRYKVMIDLEVLLNSEKEALLSLDLLNQGSLENYNWTPRSSGIEISNRYLNELEALWTDFLMTKDTR